jgi:hypothetical protein
MKVLLVESSKIGSRLIKWGLNSKGSHIALCFFDKLVVHSSVFGVELQWFNTFKKHYKIVKEKEIVMIAGKEHVLLDSLMDEDDDDSYDYPAFFYFVWRGLLLKLFKIPLPSKNKFDQANSNLCTELILRIPKDALKEDKRGIKQEEIAILSPDDALDLII